MADPLDSLPLFRPGGEVMRPAVDFINSIGVVTHMRYTNTPYWQQYETVFRPRLLESGIRHLREGLASNSPWIFEHYRDLAGSGIDFSLLCDPRKITPEDALAMMKQIGPGIAFIEGPNEFDKIADQAWVPVAQAYVRQLHTVMRSDPATHSIPILSPSFMMRSTPALVGDISDLIDYGNIHPYPYPHPPTETRPVEKAISIFNGIYGGKPFIATETGYHTGGPNSDRPLSETCRGNTCRASSWRTSIQASCAATLYEFLDEGTNPDDSRGSLRSAAIRWLPQARIHRSAKPHHDPAGHPPPDVAEVAQLLH